MAFGDTAASFAVLKVLAEWTTATQVWTASGWKARQALPQFFPLYPETFPAAPIVAHEPEVPSSV